MSHQRQSYSYSIATSTVVALGARVAPFGIVTIRLAATSDCYVVIGASPVATVATGMLLRSSTIGEHFRIADGEQVSVITAAATGVLNVTEMTA